MRLADMSAEQILAEIEKRSEALLKADEHAGAMDADLKAWEALTAVAHRDAGLSMAEAEKRVRSHEDWCQRYLDLQKANAQAAHAKRHYQKAVIAQDLWRTERASMRAA